MATVMDALSWARRGFKIFPCIRHSKKPAVSGFELIATQDENVIRAWWIDPLGRDLDHNIGVLCNDMLVFDLDTKRTKQAIDNFVAVGGHMNTLTVQTPTGGFHCYFNGPDSRLAVDLVPGVDVRSHNGYVLAPGSYVDDLAKNVRGHYAVLYEKPIADCPASLALMQSPPRDRTARSDGIEEDAPGSINAAILWLSQTPPAVEGSGGDNHTYQTACVLVRDFALSVEVSYSLMLEYWNDRCVPPWEAGELYRKIENANEYATGATGSKAPETLFGDVNIPEQPTPESQFVYQPALVKFGNARQPGETPPRPWIMPGVLMRGQSTVLVAPGGAGKSLVSLIIAAHMACGMPHIEEHTRFVSNTPRRSIIVNAEDDLDEQSRRLQAICLAYNLPYSTVSDRVMLISPDVLSIFLGANSRGVLEENTSASKYIIDLVRSYPDVDMLALDPLVNLHAFNENSNTDMNFLIRNIITRIARESQVGVLLSHHTGKPSGRGRAAGDPDMARGAGAVINAPRIALTMTNPSDDDIEDYHLTEPGSYVRIDDAKTNVHRKLGQARWFKWDTFKVFSGDGVGVLLPMQMTDRTDSTRLQLAKLLHALMISLGQGRISMAQAAQFVIQNDPLYARSAITTVRSVIQRAFTNAYEFQDGEGRNCYIRIERATVSGRDAIFVVIA